VFYTRRQTLVLKRFFATPVRREIVVISESLARLIFQLSGAVIIIGIGHFAFSYTLIHGFFTFIQMMALSAIALIVFMGFGFIISSVVKNETSIPPFANLITLPQFLLAGTFFPVDAFPPWLQPISRALPLTFFNHAIRLIAFEGATLVDVWPDIMWLSVWGVIVYSLASRLFKWE
jgi:ABC-2 type transport system permease protein